ncbi:10903_t:CDS:1 [Funneliformis geosporum]|uniref:475_t:CDS:1 n=1 Tax=Funneliformis geosporum TaxID=1117311 RepID=A0A9W4WMA5_9GLOM|nr:10903_t:CDS:1 [Funneliformis geosporum]CAI2164462.1 475_t:CDS:1 [Funneliformis geosporum]
MFTASNQKTIFQYENEYKKAFLTFFKFLTSENGIDENKRKFVLDCIEKFVDTEGYDSTKRFVLDIFEEVGFETVQNERSGAKRNDNTIDKNGATSNLVADDNAVLEFPMKIDLQQMHLLQFFQRALALNVATGSSNKRIFGFKIPFVNDHAFFVKTLYLGTIMVRYKREGESCVPEIVRLDKIPNGWKIDGDRKPLDGTTIFDFYQQGLKTRKYFMEKKTKKLMIPILFGSKKCVN